MPGRKAKKIKEESRAAPRHNHKMKTGNRIFDLFCLISLGGILSFVIVLFIENADAAQWLVMEHNFKYQFSDFFRQIVYSSDLQNIYYNTADAPFPPFAYLCFHFLYKLNPINVPIELKSWEIIQNYQFNLLIYVMFMIVTTVFFVKIIETILQKYKEKNIILFVILILCSAPFMSGVIERGNIAIIVCILLLWAMYLMDSEVIWEKELALILIAVAASFKIYPAIFGIIYLRERRWKEAGRLFIYGICFFLFPFIFTGGIDGLRQYMNVLSAFRDVEVCRWTNIKSYLAAVVNTWSGGKYQLNTTLGIIIENSYFLTQTSHTAWCVEP